jgi:hypothetical protein
MPRHIRPQQHLATFHGEEPDNEDGVLRRVEVVALLARSRDGDL